MEFIIEPYKGTDKIYFGMSREEVRNSLEVEFKEFKRTPDSKFPTDYFKSLEVFGNYKHPGVLESIEFSKEANVTFEGVRLFDLSYQDLKEFFLKKDENLMVENDGFTSNKLGIGAWAPYAEEEPDAPAESIIVFEKGYYDSSN